MIKKIGSVLLCVGSLLATNVFAATAEDSVQQLAVSLDYELFPNTPLVIANTFFWKITANCTISSPLPDNSISITVLSKSGSLNGIPLTAGQSLVWVVHPGEVLNISAESGGKVELNNLEDQTINASCTNA